MNTDKHQCEPPERPEGYRSMWFCPVCDTAWHYEAIYRWVRDD